jgi:hypothetical protein
MAEIMIWINIPRPVAAQEISLKQFCHKAGCGKPGTTGLLLLFSAADSG